MSVRPKLRYLISLCLLLVLPFTTSFGQDYPEYDEIALFLDVPDLGGTDMDVLIKGNEVYLPITDLFDFLKIRNIPAPGLDTISGFFIHQDAPYLIDRVNNQIQYNGETYKLKPGDLIRTETNLYLRGKYFGTIFGLENEFSFRTLSVRINTRLELPAIREMRLENMRKNIKRLAGEEEADTTIERRYPFFHFGMADWSANVMQQTNGEIDSRLGLALGGMLAGGEATAILNYNSYSPFTEKQQYYLWRYVNNDNKAVRQVMAGKIATGATSSIYDPVVGAKITNASTHFRRSFGTYTLTDYTEPNWIVELYVNNVLVDYTTADASGFFTFEVPLVYGNTNVMLKFYGPYGEERTREQNITIPFNFLPRNKLEYAVSAGMVENNEQSAFSRTSLNYGLSRYITIGSGVEYLSSVSSGQFMPYLNGSFRLASNLMLSGEFSPAVRSRGTLTYRLPSSLQFDINYVYYKKGQTAIDNNFREERKFSMSMPLRFTNFSVYNRLSVNQLVLPSSYYTTAEWLISGVLFGVSTNITSYAVYVGDADPYYYSDLSLSFRLPKDITIQPRVQYSYSNDELLSAKVLAEKRVLKKGYLTASVEQNFKSDVQLVEFGFRYDFKFAQTSFSARQTNRYTVFTQFARGSIVNDAQTNYVYTDNRTNVGRGGISIVPFLDVNGNGTKDPGEPKVYGLNLRANSGRIEKREADTTIRIFGLEPYTQCFIELDQSSLDNIAWRLKNKSMNVEVDPNMMKLIEIPIMVVGEAAGMVMFNQNGTLRGLGRVIVNFYDKNQKIIGRTLSEADGYFSYFGLQAGEYEVRLDTGQLKKLQMTYSPDSISFSIAALLDGDYVDGLDFVISMDTLKKVEPPPAMEMIVHERTELDLIGSRDQFVVEIGPWVNESEAESLADQLSSLLSKPVTLIPVDGVFKLHISGFNSREEVEAVYPALQNKGINEIGLIDLRGTIEPRLLTIVEGRTTDTVKSLIGKDTVTLLVQKVIHEDLYSPVDLFTIETRAVTSRAEAERMRVELAGLTGKAAEVISVDNAFKVRIAGFNSIKDVQENYPEMQSKGINEIDLIITRGLIEARLLTIVPGTETDTVKSLINNDTATMVVHKITSGVLATEGEMFDIETRAYSNLSDAQQMRDQLSVLTGHEVSIVPVNNTYKLHIAGFNSMSEIQKTYPRLQSKGINEIDLIIAHGLIEARLLAIVPGAETDTVKSLINNDTATMMVHKITSETLITEGDLFTIETRTYTNLGDAEQMRDQLDVITGKEVTLVPVDQGYKLRISGIASVAELQDIYPELQSKGIDEISLVSSRELIATAHELAPVEADSTRVTIHNIVIEDTTSFVDHYAVQLGAFKREENAHGMKNRLSRILDKEVLITEEDDYAKVRVVGFISNYEVERYIPTLVQQGIREIWVITLRGTRTPDLVAGEPDIHREVLSAIQEKDSTRYIIHDVYEEMLTTGPRSYTIQLGSFNRKINADALRAKLESILNREVEIFVEDDLYRVRIIGFDNRKEAEAYLPELRKEGVDEVRVLPLEGHKTYRTAVSRIDTIGDTGERAKITDTAQPEKPVVTKPAQKPVTDTNEIATNVVTPVVVEEQKPVTIPPEKPVADTTTRKVMIRQKTDEVSHGDERRKTLEERLLEAEYRSGLYDSRWPGVEFTIQIAASRNISDPEVIRKKFGLNSEVEVTKAGEWYRFTTGRYIKFWKAREYRNILMTTKGLDDAFIVAYKDGKKIMLNDLVAIAESMPDEESAGVTGPAIVNGFSVQILATKDGNISDSEIRKKYNIDEDVFKEYNEHDGLYRYTVGSFTTYTGAVKVRNKLRARGYRDAFVVGYKDGKRVKDLNSIEY